MPLYAPQQHRLILQYVLIVWSNDDDELFPLELGRRLQDIFPKAQFKGIVNSLAYAQEDQPELFAMTIIEYLSSHMTYR